MSAVAALALLFEGEPGSAFEKEHLCNEFGEEVGLLLRTGTLTEATPARRVTCFDCDEAHDVSVEWDEAGRPCRFCVNGGAWAEVPRTALVRYAFDHVRFLTLLSDALGLRRRPEPLIDGACWRLGSLIVEGSEIAAFVGRGMNDPRRLMEVATALKRSVCAGPGLILCGARPVVELGLLPRGFKAGAFDELIALDVQGALAVDVDAAAGALGLTRRRRGEHGASSAHPGLIALIDERRKAGASMASDSDEARHILAESHDWASADCPLPNLDAIRMMVSRRRKQAR